jgi:hypothetical protein
LEVGGGMHGQPGLPRPTWAGQRQEPYLVARQQRADVGELPLSADEPGQRHGNLDGAGAEGAKRGEVGWQAGDHQLKQPLRLGQVLQPRLAEIPQPDRGRQLGAEQLPGGPGEQHLPAMPSRADPCRAVHIQAGVVLADHDRLARVDPHPDAQHRAVGPGMGGKHPLPGNGRRHRIAGLGKGNEEGVAFGADLAAVESGEGGPKQPSMLGQDLDVPVAQPLQQPGGPFDVGEQQGDRSGRQPRQDASHSHGSAQPRRNSGSGIKFSQVNV